MPTDTSAIPEIFIKSPHTNVIYGGFYGLDIDPYTNDVYVADALDYVQQGVVYRYDSYAQPVDTFKTGITPGAFCFKPSK